MKIRTVLAASFLAVGLAMGVGPAAAVPQYPDLVSDPPEDPYIETHDTGSGQRLLLRMDGFVHNIGPGPLDVDGNPQTNNVFQRIWDNGTLAFTPLTDPLPIVFETNDQHDHFHLMKISEYSLWNSAKTAQVAPSEKVGFCLYDIERIETVGPVNPVYDGGGDFCRSGLPNATTLAMGISAGWRDTYGDNLEFQWVDISNTPPGSYWLSAAIDPDNTIAEANEANNARAFAASPSVVPGHLAQPVGPLAVPYDGFVVAPLSATTFGPALPQNKAYRIVDPPDHGTLNRAAGQNFAATQEVTYAPSPGYSGADSFTYVAVDTSNAYPITPPQATVSLVVGDAPVRSVAISGAPASLVAGTSAQLSATVTNATPGVSWSVNGAAGGSSTLGTISESGLYTAPATVPTGGAATIRATSTAFPAAYADTAIQITKPPESIPAPRPPVTRVILKGRRLTVKVVPTQTGPLVVRAISRGRVLLRCAVSAKKGRTVTCSRLLPKGTKVGKIIVKTSRGKIRSTEMDRPEVELRSNGWLSATIVPHRAGTVSLRVTQAGRTVLRCEARTPAHRPFSCSRHLHDTTGRLKVVATLKSPGRSVMVRG